MVSASCRSPQALAAAEVDGGAWNRGRYSPNLLSIPAKVATASLYPPTWSGFGAGNVIRDLGTGSEPAGFLQVIKKRKLVILQDVNSSKSTSTFRFLFYTGSFPSVVTVPVGRAVLIGQRYDTTWYC